MPFDLPPLPYDQSALEPWISAETLQFHHGKHHQAYVTNLNKLIGPSLPASRSLETIILESARDNATAGVFNNAAQVWNHTFFWNSMTPSGGGAPTGELARQIDRAFGSVDAFRDLFRQTAVGQFGSGWAWLVVDEQELKIVGTANAGTPIVDGMAPLLTCDVWEHAYYLDYQNRRLDFVNAFLDKLVNWDFAAANLAGAMYPKCQFSR